MTAVEKRATPVSTADIIEAGAGTVATERDALAALAESIRGSMAGDFATSVDLLLNCRGRVIISGMGKSGHIARKIAATMASTGTPAHFVHPGEASHGDLGMVTADDVVMLISNGGESPELADFIYYSKRFSIPVIAITSKRFSTLGKAGTVVLELPKADEACPMGMAPTTSTTLTLAMGDALAVALMHARGFTQTDYGVRHPGGRLGKMLLKVSDLMQTGAAMPMVQSGTAMDAALVEMSAKRQGCIGVTNADGTLAGIFTDGDLRRALKDAKDGTFFTQAIDAVMTKNPKTIAADRLAPEAVQMMNEKSITNLFVLDSAGLPVGVIHIHDCLKAGIA